jgi:mono/diheme cytochrome c family protein
LVAAGAVQSDVATAILRGCLAQQDVGRAKAFLDTLPGSLCDEAHRDFLWGAYWRSQGNFVEAETWLKRALDARPGHELARVELTALFEDRCQFDRALPECVELAIRSRGSEPATIRLVRVLRAQARLQEARALLAPLAAVPQPADVVLFEMAWIELESGDCERAERLLRRLPFGEATFRALYPLALVTLSLRAKGAEAERLSGEFAARTDRSTRILDLRFRLANNGNDLAARDELQRLERRGASAAPKDFLGPSDPGPGSPDDSSAATAGDLYARHCSACHGAAGEGHGPASRHLFPRPQPLRTGRSRLVSTRNAAPTLEDLEQVLAQGMPGTAMPSFKSLTESQRGLLAREVLRLRREGAREQVLRALRDAGEEADESEVRRTVEVLTTPGEPVAVPRSWHSSPQVAARGRQSYVLLACNKCHGDDGTGTGGVPLFDDQGEPTRARDLVSEPFKGGHEPRSIYLRIAAGMPGTHHPAVGDLPEQQLADLVVYVSSLARTPQRVLTNFERRVVADRRE